MVLAHYDITVVDFPFDANIKNISFVLSDLKDKQEKVRRAYFICSSDADIRVVRCSMCYAGFVVWTCSIHSTDA